MPISFRATFIYICLLRFDDALRLYYAPRRLLG